VKGEMKMRIALILSLVVMVVTVVIGGLFNSYFVIDRIEKEYVVVESSSGKMTNIRVSLLPQGIKEGDCLVYQNGKFSLDDEKTLERGDAIKNFMNRLFN
jgi:hypothetical protein